MERLSFGIFYLVLLFAGIACQSPKLTNVCDPQNQSYQIFNFLVQNGMFPSPNERCIPNPKTGITNSSASSDPASNPVALTITPELESGVAITKSTKLSFRMNQIVSFDKCSVGSSFASDSFTKDYTLTEDSGSKLTLTPTTGWNPGVFKEITLDCTSDKGNKTEVPFSANYTIADQVRFVRANGSNSNNGLTSETALATIPQAITSLSSSCTSSSSVCYILVAERTYSLSSSLTYPNLISIYGGFSSNFKTRKNNPRDADYIQTILEDSRISTGGTLGAPIALVSVDGAYQKENSELNGFILRPATGGTGYSVGIYYGSGISGNGIKVNNVKIEMRNPGIAVGILSSSINSGDFFSNTITQSGSFSGATIHGVLINAVGSAFSRFESNQILMGDCTGSNCFSEGIRMETGAALATLSNNTIRLGNATSASSVVSGIRLFADNLTPAMTWSGNTIQENTCTGTDCFTIGINLSVGGLSNKLNISNNTIHGGICTVGNCETKGISITGSNSGSDVDIFNNTINAGSSVTTSGSPYSYGIRMDTAISSFVNIRGNTITNGTTRASTGIAVGIRIVSTGTNEFIGIVENRVTGGSGNFVFALWGSPASNIPILRNRFEGGTSTSSGNATVDITLGQSFRNNIIIGGNETSGPSTAVRIMGGAGQIFAGNTIVGRGSGTETIGLELGSTNSVTVQANIILTDSGSANRYCVKEAAATYGPALFTENALFDCPTAYYVDPDSAGPNKQFWCSTSGGVFSTFGGCGQPMSSPAGSNNPSPVDPQFFDRANGKYCLSGSTPSTISAGATYFGTNVDFNGNNRPGPTNYAIGAYEPGSTCN